MVSPMLTSRLTGCVGSWNSWRWSDWTVARRPPPRVRPLRCLADRPPAMCSSVRPYRVGLTSFSVRRAFSAFSSRSRRSRSAFSRSFCSASRRASSSAASLRRCSSSASRRASSSWRCCSRPAPRAACASSSARRCGLLGLARAIDLLLRGARLLLEHVALDVGPLGPHLDLHGTRLAHRGGDLDLRLGAPLERDAPRCRGTFFLAMRLAQVRQQLELGVLADDVVGAADLDAGFVELREQLVDRHLKDLGELRYGDFCHSCLPRGLLQACSAFSNQWARAAMISFPARSSSRPGMSAISSTACSARSSRVRTPRAASS